MIITLTLNPALDLTVRVAHLQPGDVNRSQAMLTHAAGKGVNVARVRFCALACGGFLSGMAGAYLSLVFTPGWKEGISGGQGWIAVAIVIFAGWRPWPALAGALFFGFLSALQFFFQATSVHLVPLYVLRILPYVLTILTLSLAMALGRRGNAPAGLGKPFFREN